MWRFRLKGAWGSLISSGHSDEAMLRDPKHPAHRSGREGMWVALLVVILGIIFWTSVEVTWLGTYWKIVVTFGLAAGLGYPVGWLFASMDARHKRRLQDAYREDQKAEVQRKLEEAKASGAFDRWEKK